MHTPVSVDWFFLFFQSIYSLNRRSFKHVVIISLWEMLMFETPFPEEILDSFYGFLLTSDF